MKLNVNPLHHKVAYLDGIRGVAAFFVFIHHFLLAFYPSYHTFDPNASNFQNKWDIRFGQSVFSAFANGNFCVFIFFVLSGYVLSRKYFQTKAISDLVSGAQRRFVRLYIPVAFTLCLAYLMMVLGLFSNVEVSRLRHSEWWMGGFWTFHFPLDELLNCLLYDTMFRGNSNFDTSLWTIASEFSGSIFVFSFLALTHRIERVKVVLFFVILYCMFMNSPILTAFALGISLNYFSTNAMKKINPLIPVILLLLGIYLGSYPSGAGTEHTAFAYLSNIIKGNSDWFHVIGAFSLVLAFLYSPALQKAASTRFLRFLGRISFSLYLLHPLLIGSVSCFFYLKLYPALGGHLAVLCVFIITVIVCFYLSWLMTKYVDERGGIRLSKYIYDRWFKPKEVVLKADEVI